MCTFMREREREMSSSYEPSALVLGKSGKFQENNQNCFHLKTFLYSLDFEIFKLKKKNSFQKYTCNK